MFGITNAIAASTTAAQASTQSGNFASILMLVGFFLIFYLFIIRPQSKRNKEHKQLLAQLSPGDEVATHAGLLGKVTNVGNQFVQLQIAPGIEIKIQKTAIASNLPKGSLDSLQ